MNLNQNQFYIDKTEELQKGIEGFPFVYIEGFAACGKSTAVQMFLSKYPEAEITVVDVKEELTLDGIENQGGFLVFENMNRELSETEQQRLTAFLEHLPADVKVIFVGRERPDECLLPFLWNRKLEIIPSEALLFTKVEIQEMILKAESSLNAGEVYEQTGGWAGCVDMMIRQAKMREKYHGECLGARELRASYEVEGYIQSTIMRALSDEERKLFLKSLFCPFVNEKLYEEVFGVCQAGEVLHKLHRKGLLQYDAYRKCWKTAGAFRDAGDLKDPIVFVQLARWYEKEGFVQEAISCIKASGDEEAYLDFLQKYYDQIEPSYIPGDLLLSKKKTSPEMCYLQGLYNYMNQDFTGLDREIVRLEKMDVTDTHQKYEILLNLYYLKPDFSLESWMNVLVKYGEMYSDGKKFRLYHMLGHGHTFLCGFRDLSGLFACTRKEENQNARVWETFLGREEKKCYQLARIDYYLETERRDKICDEDWEVLYEEESSSEKETGCVRLFLAGKLLKMDPTEEREEHFSMLCRQMKNLPDEANVIRSITQFFAGWTKEKHQMTRWLRTCESMVGAEIHEQNYTELCFVLVGFLQLNQFEKANRILKKMIPYLQKYHRTKMLAEVLFQQAVVGWKTGRHGQAIQNVIESFLIGAPYRYVDFYTDYGMAGKEVLDAYEEWCRTNIPEKWHRKKKYQYGSVLLMPEADYVGVVLRLAHKKRAGSKITEAALEEIRVERLTMTETMILQAIGRGCTNAQICEELNLKLTTVKTHIYSMYKKLGVNSRVQAVNKGKEMGIV